MGDTNIFGVALLTIGITMIGAGSFTTANNNIEPKAYMQQYEKAKELCESNGGIKSFEPHVQNIFETQVDENGDLIDYGDISCNDGSYYDL